MPMYEFVCEKCGHKFDKIQGYSSPNPKCPCQDDEGSTCEGETKKIVSLGSFQLVGGGWAKDGY